MNRDDKHGTIIIWNKHTKYVTPSLKVWTHHVLTHRDATRWRWWWWCRSTAQLLLVTQHCAHYTRPWRPWVCIGVLLSLSQQHMSSGCQTNQFDASPPPGLWTILETNSLRAGRWESRAASARVSRDYDNDNLRKSSANSSTLMETSFGFRCNTSPWNDVCW